ncbi:MAG: hybrid sensor histidine kinase/response regulator [Prevotella sp.]|nr:hybrid sensor histidine kinase/response regulator [Prevotella sp.]
MEAANTLESQINRSDYKILIVDDVVSNVLLLKILLTNEKFQVCTANCGNMCIEQAKAEKPDLILLDVMMPDISGFDTAVILKKDPELKDIPIIFLTALNSPADLVKGFQVGANDFLSKPFNKEELVVRVMHQIALVAAKRLIEKQNRELLATINNRDKMYSVIAHDLRSPMASIRMVLNLAVAAISPDVVGQEIFDLIDKANKESEDVHDLLDNLLKWTKSQTGRLNVVMQDLDLNDIIPGVVDIFEMIAATKKIKLAYTGSSTIVRADNDMLKTIVRNFMSNAVKFSPENSSIEISVTTEGDSAKISVRDYGVGIAADRIGSIFHKGETTYGTDGEEGSGLGLQLCQDFARKIGGDVMVQSVEGEGSTFSVLIPLKKD